MLGYLDVLGRIARDDPTVWRILPEWLEIFRFAGHESQHFAALEEAARLARAGERDEVGAE